MAGGSGDAVVIVRELERVRNEQRKEREAGTAQLKDEIRLIKKELARAEAEKAEATRNREVVEREVRRRAEATELSGLLSGQENSVGSRVKHYRSMCPVCAVM
ncbi:hypothetical protein, conserved [Leishmania tarentolae]|uniref:Uncharacterized protein n=1 Tax=Leishmania tarentolae TaxID=5689 RepID=A0A640KR35_LEITA|nr:hypothetical protein, conserved [Leishmania tarentolae]